MANYSRLSTAVSSYENIIDALKSFLTASAPGPSWIEDATYLNAAHAGEMYIKNANGTPLYVYMLAETVDSVSTLQFYYVPGASNNYGAGSGPTLHRSEEGVSFTADFTLYDYVLHQFADGDRCVAVLKGTLKLGKVSLTSAPSEHFQIVYFGAYTPGDSTNDTYPLVLLGNSSADFATVAGHEWDFFPASMVKALTTTGIGRGFHRDTGANQFRVSRPPTVAPPRNSYGSEAFAFTQEVSYLWPGREYAFTLIAMYIAAADLGLEATISVGGSNHYSVPSLGWVSPQVAGGFSNVYLLPIGTAI